MKASLIFTLSCLAFIASLGDVRVINVTNNIVGYNTTNKSFSMTSGDSLRVNIKAVRGASNVNFSVAGGHSFRGDLFSFKDQTRYRYMTAGEDLSPTINQSSGEVRIVFGVVDDPGEYGIEVWAVPSSNQSQQFPVALHYLTVTSAPSSGVTLSGDVTINYPTGGTVSNIVASNSNHWDASTGTYHYNTNDTAGSGITITTNGTGNVVTNLTTDGSAVTMELGTVSSDANTLEGYTAQEVADLPRSTADLDFTTLTWAQTTSISRADGVFQRLVTEGPSWVRVPAGLTNSGYMINLEIAATTNPITFLPDNILIATNLYTYTNRTMSFLLHNAWDEETVGVYGLKRDND